ncbi:MAG: hypothetical protein RLZZ15_3946 [Verrucomicrobiota bacterium]
MKLDRLAYRPDALLDFFEEGLGALGGLCARPWHDRLEVVAEGAAARLWRADGELHSAELQFVAAGETGARDAQREVFPGCPLTFQLAEALRPSPPPLERAVLEIDGAARPPDAAVIERLWRQAHPDTLRWRLASPLTPAFHHSLVALVRCEVQATDQHWSLHRVALGLPDGRADDGLAREIGFARLAAAPAALAWPTPDPTGWSGLLTGAIEGELAGELAAVRARQEGRLARELTRVDDYFANYERELAGRASRGRGATGKFAERLAAAKAEHARHRADQVARHEIVVVPHVDALLLVAEPAWRGTLHIERAHRPPAALEARFVPRARRWETAAEARA